MYVGHVVFLVTRHCVWNVWYSLLLSLPVSSKCYSLSFITDCIQPVLAWHARLSVLFSYRTCSSFQLQHFSPTPLRPRSFPFPLVLFLLLRQHPPLSPSRLLTCLSPVLVWPGFGCLAWCGTVGCFDLFWCSDPRPGTERFSLLHPKPLTSR